jgi:hypothetical protein
MPRLAFNARKTRRRSGQFVPRVLAACKFTRFGSGGAFVVPGVEAKERHMVDRKAIVSGAGDRGS